jgi:hypothetical protein
LFKLQATIESLLKQLENEKLDAEAELDELKLKCEKRESDVDQERMLFVKMKKDSGLRSIVAQTGRPFTLKEVEFYLDRERQKEREVIGVPIENIKLKNQLKKKENELKAKEKFGEGLHMIDFLEGRIEHLKRKHAELILSSKGIKQKIAQTKTDKPLV